MSKKTRFLTSAGALAISDLFFVVQGNPVKDEPRKIEYGAFRAQVGGTIGLLKDADGLDVGGAPVVHTEGNEEPGVGAASYAQDDDVDLDPITGCPKAGLTASNGQKYSIVKEWGVNSNQFYDATDSSYGQCIQRMHDYLLDTGINGGGPDVYRSNVPALIPLGDYTSNIPIDIRVGIDLHGHGEGEGFDGANGATHIHFVNCSGFRLQFGNTYNDDDVDVSGSRKAVGRMKLRDMMLTGDGSLNHHAIVQRAIADISNIRGYEWGGCVLRAWTGNFRGQSFGGQCSTSTAKNIKGYHSQWTASLGGTDTNVYHTNALNGFHNWQGGLEDANAAGANAHDSGHYTYNGFGPRPAGGAGFTMCSHSGNIYTPNIQCVDFTIPTGAAVTSALLAANPPSGTTASNAYWLYQGPGGPTSVQPAYASGGPWIYGGDTFCMTPYDTQFIGEYHEGGGGLCQSLYRQPLWIGGTIGFEQLAGGTLVKSTDDAYEIIRAAASFALRPTPTGGSIYSVRDIAGALGWRLYHPMGGPSFYHAASQHRYSVGLEGAPAYIATIGYNGIDLDAGKMLSFNGVDTLSGQMAALADLAGGATLADVIAKVNQILADERTVKLRHA